MKIAVSGKGGVGKTTVCAALARLFAREGYSVYAVDADPDANLGLVLGVEEEALGRVNPLAAMKRLITERSGGPGSFFFLDPQVDDVVRDYSVEAGGVRLLRMGNLKKAASECYCRESSFLGAVVRSLLLAKEQVVLLDMSAGIEHLTRGTARGVDVMLIVTEPTAVSARTARTVAELARDLGIERVGFVGNKVRSKEEEEWLRRQLAGGPVLGMVRYDEDVAGRSLGPLGGELPDRGFWVDLHNLFLGIRGVGRTCEKESE